jgi:endonuclease YncB( thermonuclease family)
MSGSSVKSRRLALSLILSAVVLLLACAQSAPNSQIIAPSAPAQAPQPLAASGRTPATQTLEGRVVGVADGDTMTALGAGNRQTRVRLQGIDAPEGQQAFG